MRVLQTAREKSKPDLTLSLNKLTNEINELKKQQNKLFDMLLNLLNNKQEQQHEQEVLE